MLALLVQTPLEARADEPNALAPASLWNLDYGDDICSLRRAFGTGDNGIVLQFQSRYPNLGMSMTLAGKLLRPLPPPNRVKVRFGPASLGETAREANTGLNADRTTVLQFGGVGVNANWIMPLVSNESHADWIARGKNWPKPDPAEIAADEQRATELYFEQKGGPRLVLQTGSMTKPLHGLRNCVDDMVRSWGIDPEVQQNLSVQPEPANNPGTWVNTGDYPIKMIRERQAALVHFRLIVGDEGKVISCAVQSADGHRDLRELTCDLIKSRARFRPALNAAGKPVKSYWLSSVRWTVPPR